MSTSTWVLLLFCTFLSKMSSSFLNVLQNIICVMLMIKFLLLLYVVGARANLGASSSLVLLGLMLVSLCALLPLFSLHWLWHHATLRSNWAIKPLTSNQCSARKVALHRDFPCLGGPHLNLKNYLHATLIQLFQTKTPLMTYLQRTYMQGTCPCLTNWC